MNSRRHEIMNKITASKKNTGKENEHITLSNPYAIFELDTIYEDCATNPSTRNKADNNKVRDSKHIIISEELKEQKDNKITTQTVWNQEELTESQHIQRICPTSQDIEEKMCYNIPTLINGNTTRKEKISASRNHRRNISTNNLEESINYKPVSTFQHKLCVLGDSHLTGCVVELKSELSTSFQITGMIKPGACATNIVNTSEIEFLNLRSQVRARMMFIRTIREES